MSNTAFITVENGAITGNRTGLSKLFKSLKNGRHEVVVTKVGKRSINQNKYYWGVVVVMIKDRLNELGNDVDSVNVHDFLKDRFNTKDIFTKEGTVIGCVGDTTTKLTTILFEEYLEKCKQFASSVLEIYIPDPNQQSTLFAN